MNLNFSCTDTDKGEGTSVLRESVGGRTSRGAETEKKDVVQSMELVNYETSRWVCRLLPFCDVFKTEA